VDTITEALADGFELEERVLGGRWGVGLATRRRRTMALLPDSRRGARWMAGRLNRVRVFQ
jgi:hypothetical protein